MQNTEKMVMKRNNHPVFIDEFTDNGINYLLWFCFLWRATSYLSEQLCRHWQRVVAIFSPVQSRLAETIWNEHETSGSPGSWNFG